MPIFFFDEVKKSIQLYGMGAFLSSTVCILIIPLGIAKVIHFQNLNIEFKYETVTVQ